MAGTLCRQSPLTGAASSEWQAKGTGPELPQTTQQRRVSHSAPPLPLENALIAFGRTFDWCS